MATTGNARSGSAPKKAAAKRSSSTKQGSENTTKKASSRHLASAPRAPAQPRRTAAQIADSATRQFTELSGCDAEAITGLERDENGWQVLVEVVELRRIPNTTDLLATYEVDVDSQGDLEGYRRLRRYTRGEVREDR